MTVATEMAGNAVHTVPFPVVGAQPGPVLSAVPPAAGSSARGRPPAWHAPRMPVTRVPRGAVPAPALRHRPAASARPGAGRSSAAPAGPAGESEARADAGTLEYRYWRAVARYLEDYRESYDPRAARPGAGSGPPYRSPVQAARAADRFSADAAAARDKARRAWQDASSAGRLIGAAQAALATAAPWKWRTRQRLRADLARERARLSAARGDFSAHTARAACSLRDSWRAGQIAAAMRRSDRAHSAAAAAAGRALGWRPGKPLPARPAVYAAGRHGIEPLPGH